MLSLLDLKKTPFSYMAQPSVVPNLQWRHLWNLIDTTLWQSYNFEFSAFFQMVSRKHLQNWGWGVLAKPGWRILSSQKRRSASSRIFTNFKVSEGYPKWTQKVIKIRYSGSPNNADFGANRVTIFKNKGANKFGYILSIFEQN